MLTCVERASRSKYIIEHPDHPHRVVNQLRSQQSVLGGVAVTTAAGAGAGAAGAAAGGGALKRKYAPEPPLSTSSPTSSFSSSSSPPSSRSLSPASCLPVPRFSSITRQQHRQLQQPQQQQQQQQQRENGERQDRSSQPAPWLHREIAVDFLKKCFGSKAAASSRKKNGQQQQQQQRPTLPGMASIPERELWLKLRGQQAEGKEGEEEEEEEEEMQNPREDEYGCLGRESGVSSSGDSTISTSSGEFGKNGRRIGGGRREVNLDVVCQRGRKRRRRRRRRRRGGRRRRGRRGGKRRRIRRRRTGACF